MILINFTICLPTLDEVSSDNVIYVYIIRLRSYNGCVGRVIGKQEQLPSKCCDFLRKL